MNKGKMQMFIFPGLYATKNISDKKQPSISLNI